MIILTVTAKKFGKNYIQYLAKDTENSKTILEGKCDSMVTTNGIYKDLRNEHGEENVLLLTR